MGCGGQGERAGNSWVRGEGRWQRVCGTQPEHQQRALRPQKGSGRIWEEKSAGKRKQKCKQRTEQAGRFAVCMEQDLHGGFGRKHVAKSQCQKRKISLFWAACGTKLYLQVLTIATTPISLGNSHWTSADSKQSIYIYSKPTELVTLQRKLWWGKLFVELHLQHWFLPSVHLSKSIQGSFITLNWLCSTKCKDLKSIVRKVKMITLKYFLSEKLCFSKISPCICEFVISRKKSGFMWETSK